MKKIVAIGGGENGRVKSDGTCKPYETYEIDKEIVMLSGKKHPNFLFLGHAQLKEEYELGYFETMKRIYEIKFGCNCKILTKNELINNIGVDEKLKWADIIYEGGGDTLGMMELWRNTGFDKKLYDSWKLGKVMCGLSAGANAWFSSCSSDSLKIQRNDMNAPMINVNCLDFVDLFFCPHCNEKSEYVDRLGHMKESLLNLNLIGVGLSNCSALVIVDNEYKIITSNNDNIEPYAIKCYWKDNEYIEQFLEINKYNSLNTLVKNKIKKL